MLSLCSAGSVISQENMPAVPSKQTSLYDQARLLTPEQQLLLEQKLRRYQDTTSTQIVLVTLPSIGSNDIAMYAAELGQKWGIGQKGKDNGVLLLVAKKERKVTISTGYGVEHLLTDARCRRIIENLIKPQFKEGNFYLGLDQATNAIMQFLSGAFTRAPSSSASNASKRKALFILAVLALILFFRNRGGKHKGGKLGASSDLLTILWLSSMGSRRGFGSSYGGGFGGGFGGGSFGGGGASGSW